jgi:glycosyltransferase involved in cell wall biosynthesis
MIEEKQHAMTGTTGGMVTIGMPTYNGASRYIEEALQSVIDQTYPNWELIIVDDASTDNTQELLKPWLEREPRFRYIRHETNKKLPGGLNTSIRNMRGDYHTWLSDDDLFRPRALEAMVGFLVEHPELDLVFTDYAEIDPQGNFLQRVNVGDPDELGIHKSTGVCHLSTRRVMDKLGGYAEDLFLAEDLDYWVRAYIHFKMGALHEDLFLYRQHPGSLTNTYHQKVYRVHEQILKRHLPDMHWMDADRKAYAYLRLALKARNIGDTGSSLRFLATAFRYSPSFFGRKFVEKLQSLRANNYRLEKQTPDGLYR